MKFQAQILCWNTFPLIAWLARYLNKFSVDKRINYFNVMKMIANKIASVISLIKHT